MYQEERQATEQEREREWVRHDPWRSYALINTQPLLRFRACHANLHCIAKFNNRLLSFICFFFTSKAHSLLHRNSIFWIKRITKSNANSMQNKLHILFEFYFHKSTEQNLNWIANVASGFHQMNFLDMFVKTVRSLLYSKLNYDMKLCKRKWVSDTQRGAQNVKKMHGRKSLDWVLDLWAVNLSLHDDWMQMLHKFS